MTHTIENSMFSDRESWLTEAANLAFDDLLMPIVEASGVHDYERPNFRISVGFPKHTRGGKAVAVCFRRAASSDGVNEIFINPEIDEPIEVLSAMIHEQIHAIDDCHSGHRNFFAYVARKAGLEGHLTATFAGDKLIARLKGYIELLGAFPHNKMNINMVHRKDGTRQLKVSCTNCDFSFRTSMKQVVRISSDAACPCCMALETLKLIV